MTGTRLGTVIKISFVSLDLKSGDGHPCENNDHYRPCVGRPSGSKILKHTSVCVDVYWNKPICLW